jgi:hypothetical protein
VGDATEPHQERRPACVSVDRRDGRREHLLGEKLRLPGLSAAARREGEDRLEGAFVERVEGLAVSAEDAPREGEIVVVTRVRRLHRIPSRLPPQHRAPVRCLL